MAEDLQNGHFDGKDNDFIEVYLYSRDSTEVKITFVTGEATIRFSPEQARQIAAHLIALANKIEGINATD